MADLASELSDLMRDLQDRKAHSEWLIEHWPTVMTALRKSSAPSSGEVASAALALVFFALAPDKRDELVDALKGTAPQGGVGQAAGPAVKNGEPAAAVPCGCAETYPQLVPGRVSHGPGCALSATLVAQGACETTQTPRFQIKNCTCGTYEGNLGPCLTWWEGAQVGRCVYCDHNLDCHVKLSKLFAAPAAGRTCDCQPHEFCEVCTPAGWKDDLGVKPKLILSQEQIYNAVADSVNEIADAAREAFIKAGFDPGEWDSDNIVQDVKSGLVSAIEQLSARSSAQRTFFCKSDVPCMTQCGSCELTECKHRVEELESGKSKPWPESSGAQKVEMCEGSKAYPIAEMEGAPLYVPICTGHAATWFTERNRLPGGMDASCIVCAHTELAFTEPSAAPAGGVATDCNCYGNAPQCEWSSCRISGVCQYPSSAAPAEGVALTLQALTRMIESVEDDIRKEDPGNHATRGELRGELKGLLAARHYLAAAFTRSDRTANDQ